MQYGIKTLDDIDVRGKVVLCRVDISEPIDRTTGDLRRTGRINACAPTIDELSGKGARVVILAHQGSVLDYDNYYTTAPHAKALTIALGREIRFVEDICGSTARTAISTMKDGEVILLDNVRFLAEELHLVERHLQWTPQQMASTLLVRKLSSLADYYVCDCFSGMHHAQPSLCGFPQVLPSAMGRQFEQDFSALSTLTQSPAHPCLFVLGGVKVADALRIMERVLADGVADRVLTGGLVALMLLWAGGYEIGRGTRGVIRERGCEHLLSQAGALLERFHGRIILPTDYGYVVNGARRETMLHALPPDECVTDIGDGTAGMYRKMILEAGMVYASGPMGAYEDPLSAQGTRGVWAALGTTAATTLLVGGDSYSAALLYNVSDKIDHVVTGRVAAVHLLCGDKLPGVDALRHGSGLA